MSVRTLTVSKTLASLSSGAALAVLLAAGVASAGVHSMTQTPSSPGTSTAMLAPASPQAWDKTAEQTSVQTTLHQVRALPVQQGVRVTTLETRAGRPTIVTKTLPAATAAQVLTAATGDPSVVAASVDGRAQVTSLAATTSDPGKSNQWGLTALNADTTLARHTAAGTVVAVIDTGVQVTHPDLAGVVLPGVDFVTAGGDGSADGNGHGTHVAGIIAAVANNGLGGAGFGQGTKILPVRVLDDTGNGWNSNIAKGIIWAADHGATVISMSLGSSNSDSVMASAVSYARSKNVTVVASAGNSRLTGNAVNYPAAFPGVIGVGSVDVNRVVSPTSNSGSYVDLTAPGVNIFSTYKGSTWAYLSGTSMAAPFVSAAAAILKSASPALTPDQVEAVLESTATDLGVKGRDNDYGFGFLNPVQALCTVGFCGGTTVSPSTNPSVSPSVSPTTTSPAPSPSVSKTPTVSPSSTPSPTLTSPTVSPSPTSTLRLSVIKSVTVSPTATTVGSTVKVTGNLSAAGYPLKAVRVQVCTQTLAGGTPKCIYVSTDMAGTFTAVTGALSESANVYAVYSGDTLNSPVTSSSVLVTVK